MDAGAWRWDETLYAGSAEYYRAGRLTYPHAVADAFAHCRLGSGDLTS